MTSRLQVVAAMTLPLLISGCDLLWASLYAPTDPFLEPELGPSVVYESGVATIEITRGNTTETMTLDEVGPNSMLDSYIGASVTWRNNDGWILRLDAYSFTDPALGDIPGNVFGDVTVEWIAEHEAWTAGSYTSTAGNRCIVDIWEMSETVVSGRANCGGLRWSDGAGGLGLEPVFVEGQDPFDITVTFEAVPLGDTQSS